jgi:hypothetical protein
LGAEEPPPDAEAEAPTEPADAVSDSGMTAPCENWATGTWTEMVGFRRELAPLPLLDIFGPPPLTMTPEFVDGWEDTSVFTDDDAAPLPFELK